jgi:hypothetical protein
MAHLKERCFRGFKVVDDVPIAHGVGGADLEQQVRRKHDGAGALDGRGRHDDLVTERAKAVEKHLGNLPENDPVDRIRQNDAEASVGLPQQGLPAMQPGSFAALAIPMLAANAAKIANCQGGPHNAQVLAAAASMWNANSTGAPMSVYVPALSDDGTSQMFAVDAQVPYAFQPATDMNQYPSSPLSPFPTNSLSLDPTQTPAFILQLSGSTFGAKTTAPSSTAGSKLATAAVAIPATIGIGTLVYAWATGQSVETVLRELWRGTRRFVGRVTGNPMDHLTIRPRRRGRA